MENFEDKVKDVFAFHPSAKEVYATSDGQVFLKKEFADSHSATAGGLTVSVIGRDANKAEETPNGDTDKNPDGTLKGDTDENSEGTLKGDTDEIPEGTLKGDTDEIPEGTLKGDTDVIPEALEEGSKQEILQEAKPKKQKKDATK